MLHHAKLDKRFWAEAAMTAIYVKNRLPSPKIEHKTPFEIVYKSKPSVKHMRVFGCRTYILTPKEKRLKWDPKARTRIFLGYEEVSKAYRLYDIEAGQVVISRDVNFDESADGRYGSWTRSLYEAEGGTSQTVGPERRHLRGRMKIRK
ncbi:hypothetical protein Pcac1_g28686 [Phytophthora cactorum]|nr:hypothetical protein Pcac1_g28686 [Phytophthora cactorum]KAG2760570.1 hypothetical protein PC112_g25837 [Phytophthora cactorum]KAG2761147.1 hypothetical protein PC111_g25315 [Phytophthora cactorum]